MRKHAQEPWTRKREGQKKEAELPRSFDAPCLAVALVAVGGNSVYREDSWIVRFTFGMNLRWIQRTASFFALGELAERAISASVVLEPVKM